VEGVEMGLTLLLIRYDQSDGVQLTIIPPDQWETLFQSSLDLSALNPNHLRKDGKGRGKGHSCFTGLQGRST
jgi:hypothetical protein